MAVRLLNSLPKFSIMFTGTLIILQSILAVSAGGVYDSERSYSQESSMVARSSGGGGLFGGLLGNVMDIPDQVLDAGYGIGKQGIGAVRGMLSPGRTQMSMAQSQSATSSSHMAAPGPGMLGQPPMPMSQMSMAQSQSATSSSHMAAPGPGMLGQPPMPMSPPGMPPRPPTAMSPQGMAQGMQGMAQGMQGMAQGMVPPGAGGMMPPGMRGPSF